MNTQDQTQDRSSLFALFKGDSGAGKSVAAYSWPEPYVFDFDRKMPTIALKHFPGKSIEYEQFTSMSDVLRKVDSFSNHCPYRTIVADSLTWMVNLAFDTVATAKQETFYSRIERDAKNKAKNFGSLGWDYYNYEAQSIVKFLQSLAVVHTKHHVNVILIAHVMSPKEKEKDKSPDDNSVPRLGRIFTEGEKPGVIVPTVFDDIYHFGIRKPNALAGEKGVKRICWTVPIGDNAAKSSYWLPEEIDFTNGSLYEKFSQAMGSSQEDVVSEPEQLTQTSTFK